MTLSLLLCLSLCWCGVTSLSVADMLTPCVTTVTVTSDVTSLSVHPVGDGGLFSTGPALLRLYGVRHISMLLVVRVWTFRVIPAGNTGDVMTVEVAFV